MSVETLTSTPSTATTASQTTDLRGRRYGIVMAYLGGGGAEPVLREWAGMIARHGGECVFLTTHEDAPPAEVDGMPVHPIDRRGALPVVDIARGIVAAVQQYRIDTIITALPNPNLATALAQAMTRHSFTTVLSQHDIPTEIVKFDGPRQKAQWEAAKHLMRRADATIAVSHAIAGNLLAECHLRPEQLFVLPNVCLADDAEIVVGRAPAIESGSLTLVVPCRQVPFKRPETAIEVAEICNRTVPTRVEYFGAGPLHDSIQQRADASEVEVVLRGRVENWQDEIPADGIALLTSATEGFGIVMIEAAARSVPAVASSRGLGVADAIIPGLTGQLCMGDEPADYARAVLQAAGMRMGDVTPWLRRFQRTAVEEGFIQVLHSIPAPSAHDASASAK